MSILLTQQKIGNSGGYNNTNAQTFTSNVTAGSMLFIGIIAGAGRTVASVVDTRSNTWISTGTPINSTGERKSWGYYVNNAVSGSTTVTVTFGAGEFEDSIVFLMELSGVVTTSALDQYVATSDGSFLNTHSSGTTGTTSQANEIAITFVGSSSGGTDPLFTVPSGYTGLTQGTAFDVYTWGAIAYKLLTATGTQTSSFGSTSYVYGQTILATFKQASSTTNSNFFQLM